MTDSLSTREAAVERTFRFGVFEVDVRSGELRKRGVRIALQEKPFRLLVTLLERPGSIVSRDELQQQLWRADTFVDFEQGLNAAIKRLREALGDSADNPVFIETLPRRGYRFIQALMPEPTRDNDISPARSRTAVWRGLVPAAAALGVFGAGALTASLWLTRQGRTRGSGPSVSYPIIDVRPAAELNAGGSSDPKDVPTPGGSRTALAWTHDGSGLVFVGREGDVRRLYVRWLDRDLALPIKGTEGAQIPTTSPDGHSVVFWSKRAIRKVAVSGGPVATIVELPPPGLYLPHGISVDSSDRVLIGTEEDGVIKLAAGGTMKPVTTLSAGETEHLLPHWLPGGRGFLYTIRHRHLTWGDEQIVGQDLATGRRTDLLRDAADGRYAAGRLYFMRRGTLWSVPFDAGAIALKGEAAPVVNNVAQALTGSASLAGSLDVTGAGQFAVSAAGALAYIESAIVPTPETRLVTVDRHGTVTGVNVPPRAYQFGARASPDGRLLAVTISTLTEQALWTIDLTANGTLTKITPEGEAFWPEWTRDGRALVFSWLKGGVTELALASLPSKESYTPVIKPVMRTDWYLASSSISPDGRTLVAVNGRDLDLVQVSLAGSGVPTQKVFKTAAAEAHAVLSPDGLWLAYGSDETGRGEVYLERFPRDGSRRLVSNDGGSPVWNPRGGELFFLAPGPRPDVAQFMAVAVDARGSTGRPQKLFEFDFMQLHLGGAPARLFDPSADGERFFTTERIASPAPVPVTQIRLIFD